jgi:hypothetical protein
MQLPIQSQPVLRNIGTAKIGGKMPGVTASNWTHWGCLRNGSIVSQVEIWWGHTPTDGAWACNDWRSECQGECWAVQI